MESVSKQRKRTPEMAPVFMEFGVQMVSFQQCESHIVEPMFPLPLEVRKRLAKLRKKTFEVIFTIELPDATSWKQLIVYHSRLDIHQLRHQHHGKLELNLIQINTYSETEKKLLC
jgi:hypothetical protein